MKSSINKHKAHKKFYQGQFESLLDHENVYSCDQKLHDNDCTLVCRAFPNSKRGRIEVHPIGLILSNDVQGKVKPVLSTINNLEAVILQDVDSNNATIKTVGIQLSDELTKEVVDEEIVRQQILPKVK